MWGGPRTTRVRCPRSRGLEKGQQLEAHGGVLLSALVMERRWHSRREAVREGDLAAVGHKLPRLSVEPVETISPHAFLHNWVSSHCISDNVAYHGLGHSENGDGYLIYIPIGTESARRQSQQAGNNMTQSSTNLPVLIVGTGPVGLFQAHALAKLGSESWLNQLRGC